MARRDPLVSRLPSKPAYGPQPQELRNRVGGRPVVLVIGAQDEADLMMHVGAAPPDPYRALIRGRPQLRKASPQEAVLFLPDRLSELVLERFGLGFPTNSVVVRNYEMVTWTDNGQCKGAILKRTIKVVGSELQLEPSDSLLLGRLHDASVVDDSVKPSVCRSSAAPGRHRWQAPSAAGGWTTLWRFGWS